MTDNEANELDRYAASMQLQRPCVCVLLILRELRERRLSSLKATASPRLKSDEPKRVTAHIKDPLLKKAYEDHVKSCGLGSDEATAVLFRAELRERWLFGNFGWPWNHP
jgi:hypothetical protein